ERERAQADAIGVEEQRLLLERTTCTRPQAQRIAVDDAAEDLLRAAALQQGTCTGSDLGAGKLRTGRGAGLGLHRSFPPANSHTWKHVLLARPSVLPLRRPARPRELPARLRSDA